jgi:quercetin dioxygenase-like cupin family protein
MSNRIFNVEQFVRFSDQSAVVKEIVVTEHSRIAVWCVRPGQKVPTHTHPSGQEMMRGELTYLMGNGQRTVIRAGELDVADHDEVHGAVNDGTEDAVFLSIYSAPEIGWEKAEA